MFRSFFIYFLITFFAVNFNCKVNVLSYFSTPSYKHECTKHFDIEKYFSTKTPYRAIVNKNDTAINYPGCAPIRMWSIIRHGARNPSKKIIVKAKQRLGKIRQKILSSTQTKLCQHELAVLRNWHFNIDENHAKNLVYEGEYELIELAERFQNRFPDLLLDVYDPSYYKFKFTATQRTLRSAESFTVGLFGRYNTKDIHYPEPLHKDPVLRFYKLCTRWKNEVDKKPDTLIEKMKFLKSDYMKNVIREIENKTGVKGFTANDVELMYTICAFETTWSKRRRSIWCSFFNEDSIKVLEYAEDLEYYWIDGYGHNLTHEQACSAFVDMIYHISPESHYPNATFYFTHSGTILKLLAHLGMYKDKFVLTHGDFDKYRQWRTSEIDAFASNIAFITFQCNNEEKVLTLHQERIIHLPGCPQSEDLCSLNTIKDYFKNSIENCDFEKMCQINN